MDELAGFAAYAAALPVALREAGFSAAAEAEARALGVDVGRFLRLHALFPGAVRPSPCIDTALRVLSRSHAALYGRMLEYASRKNGTLATAAAPALGATRGPPPTEDEERYRSTLAAYRIAFCCAPMPVFWPSVLAVVRGFGGAGVASRSVDIRNPSPSAWEGLPQSASAHVSPLSALAAPAPACADDGGLDTTAVVSAAASVDGCGGGSGAVHGRVRLRTTLDGGRGDVGAGGAPPPAALPMLLAATAAAAAAAGGGDVRRPRRSPRGLAAASEPGSAAGTDVDVSGAEDQGTGGRGGGRRSSGGGVAGTASRRDGGRGAVAVAAVAPLVRAAASTSTPSVSVAAANAPAASSSAPAASSSAAAPAAAAPAAAAAAAAAPATYVIPLICVMSDDDDDDDDDDDGAAAAAGGGGNGGAPALRPVAPLDLAARAAAAGAAPIDATSDEDGGAAPRPAAHRRDAPQNQRKRKRSAGPPAPPVAAQSQQKVQPQPSPPPPQLQQLALPPPPPPPAPPARPPVAPTRPRTLADFDARFEAEGAPFLDAVVEALADRGCAMRANPEWTLDEYEEAVRHCVHQMERSDYVPGAPARGDKGAECFIDWENFVWSLSRMNKRATERAQRRASGQAPGGPTT